MSINVPDLHAALGFYVGLLGLTPRDDRPDLRVGGAWLDAGGQQVHLIEREPPPACGQHFALLVHDLDEVVDELRGCGVHVPEPVPIGTSRQTFVEDPAGNVVELHQAA